MKIMVTGAAGFIGSFLCRALINRGDHVIGVDNFNDYYERKAKDLNVDLIRLAVGDKPEHFGEDEIRPIFDKVETFSAFKKTADGKFEFFEADIRDTEKMDEIFKAGVDKVIHLGAMAGVPYSLKEPSLYIDVNVDGTVVLLELCAKYGIKNFVFGSSSSVYGGRTNVPFVETDDVSKPISAYSASKRMGELICYTYHHLYKFPVTCARIFGPIYGPLQRPYGMAAQRFIRQVYQGRKITIYGDGEMGRDSTYIDDEVAGLIKCLDKDFEYEIINIGTGKPVTVIQLARMVVDLSGKGELEHIEKPPTEVPITYADVSKAKDLLDFEAKVDFFEGLRRQYDVFMLMPDWYKDIKG